MFLLKLQKTLAFFYDGLPGSVRQVIGPAVESRFRFIKRLLAISSQIRSPIYMLKGKQKESGELLTVCVMSDEQGRRYISDLLFSETPISKNLGRKFVWNLRSQVATSCKDIDLFFIRTDKFYSEGLSRQGMLILPEWVLFRLPLTRPPMELWNLPKNKSLRETLRIVHRNKYSYEVSRDPKEFHFFYHHMYYPYIAQRYGRLAPPHSFLFMRRAFEKGFLFLIKKEGRNVGGGLARTDGRSVFLSHLGVLDGEIRYTNEGALGALYYFLILWSREKGYQWLDMGSCKPFLKDGVFFYKKKWGMEIERSGRSKTVLGIGVCSNRPCVGSFFATNPFIFIEGDKLKGLVFLKSNERATLKEIEWALKRFDIPGLDELILVSPHGFTSEAKAFRSPRENLKFVLFEMSEEQFFGDFPDLCLASAGMVVENT